MNFARCFVSMACNSIPSLFLVRLVPPLRGSCFAGNAYPPFPRWATLFRPLRDSAAASAEIKWFGATCGLIGATYGLFVL
jgi:hypothetical protein